MSPIVDVVIPALDEARSLPLVLAELPRERVREIVVVDNGSRDGTGAIARRLGCALVEEPRRGYGSACLAGLAHVAARTAPPGIVVFLDADHVDHAAELPRLLEPIERGRADLVVGSRVLGRRERGGMLPRPRFADVLGARLIRALYGVRVTDLGSFRAIRWPVLATLGLRERDAGWAAEMQVKAIRRGLRYAEVPIPYRSRAARSKFGSAPSVTLVATILRHAWF